MNLSYLAKFIEFKKSGLCLTTLFFCLVLLLTPSCTQNIDKSTSAQKSTKDSSKTPTNKNAQEEEDDPVEVFTEELVDSEIYDPLYYYGFLQAEGETKIYSAQQGMVAKIYVNPGEMVRAGQKILAINPSSGGLEFNDYMVRAPRDGQLSFLSVSEGQWVDVNKYVASVSKIKFYYSTISVHERDIGAFKIGQAVQLLVGKEGSIKEINSSVVYVGVRPNPQNFSYDVKVKVDCVTQKSACNELKVGEVVKLALKKNKRKGVEVISKSLVNNQSALIVVDSDLVARHIYVQLGVRNGDQVELISDELNKLLGTGARYVTSFGRFPKDKSKVILKDKLSTMKGILSRSQKKDDKG